MCHSSEITKCSFEVVQLIANLATAFTFAAAAWQLFETNKQSKKSAVQKRSEYIIELYNTYVNDKKMIDMYYLIEYNKLVYNPTVIFPNFDFKFDRNFQGTETEKDLDKLLGHFSNIGRLYVLGILTKEDLNFFKYEFLRIHTNQSVKEYLKFLDNWFRVNNIIDKKFEHFRIVAEMLNDENKN